MWSKKIQHVTGRKGKYNYNDIPIYCASGVHEKVIELIINEYHNTNIKILILGAGAGAFDERLFDKGYINITAVELNKEIYRSKGRVIGLDLNQEFCNKIDGKFDCVIAIEIIEHLENHFQFIRNVDSLLVTGGRCFVTTPNIESSLARVKYWIVGDFPNFTDNSIKETGHINPLFRNIFLYYVHNHTEMRLKALYSNKSIWNIWGGGYESIGLKISLVFAFFLSVFILHKDNKEILIMEMEKSSSNN